MKNTIQNRFCDYCPPCRRRSLAFLLVLACLGAPLTMRAQATSQLIDGAVNPEMIPDWRAYSVLFRFISNRTGEERSAIIDYLHMIGLGREFCEGCADDAPVESAQIDTLIATAEEFSKSAADLDAFVKGFVERHPELSPGSEEMLQFEREKERLCLQAIGMLGARLGLYDFEKVRSHVELMKRKMHFMRKVQATP